MSVTKSKLEVREFKSDKEFDRIAELWANMAMVQQMQGRDYWVKKHKESGIDWLTYIHNLKKEKSNKFIVFEDPKKIFGFAFLETKKTTAKLVEIYMEPSHQNLTDKEITTMLIESLKKMGLEKVDMS